MQESQKLMTLALNMDVPMPIFFSKIPLIFFFPGAGEREGLFICFRKSQKAL